jgi:hypothetical protein
MISLVIYIVVIALVYWLVSLLPLPAPAPMILRVLFILILILVLLSAFGVVNLGMPRLRG